MISFVLENMPFFGNKFSPKKILQRKSNSEASKEALTDQRKVNLKLGEQQFIFENGDWVPVNGESRATFLSKQKLEKRIQDLEEQNNLLRLRYEMMLIMFTQAVAKNDINPQELEKLKKKKK